MAYDICLKIKDLGDVYGSFMKSTQNSVYLSNAIIAKTPLVSISLFKIEKKYITGAKRMAKPQLDAFSNEELTQIISLNNPEYTTIAQKLLETRKVAVKQPLTKIKVEASAKSPAQPKVDKWNQIEENRRLFNVEPSFNVEEYASPIDREASNYSTLHAKAKKIARDLSAKSSSENKKSATKDSEDVVEDATYSTVQTEDKWANVAEVKEEMISQEQRKISELQNELALIETELKKQNSFTGVNWSLTSEFVRKKKEITNKIEELMNPKPEAPKQPAKEDVASKKKESTSQSSGNRSHVHPEDTEPAKTTEKAAHGTGRGSPKISHLEIPQIFASALQLVEFMAKNTKHSSKGAHNWLNSNDPKSAADIHFRPLVSFDFPLKEIEDMRVRSVGSKFSK